MIAIIREKEYEYTSDHPVGWKRSKGDFKFPVTFGYNKCFVKRFNKSTDSISGWTLLEKLKGKNEPGLPRVHDIVSTTERGETINYLFLEFIEGDTLNKLLAEHVEIDLEKLTDNLFSAFETINKYGFWFADFLEKNICTDRKGNFYLVDLDSAQPASRVPHKDMWGDKEYWGLVFDYYTKVLRKENFQPSQLSGVFLNYLQIIFLILRIRRFYLNRNRDRDFREAVVHPSQIDKASPDFRRVFLKALNQDGVEDARELVHEIKKLIKERIIDSYDDGGPVDPEPDEPVIEFFTIANGQQSDNQFIVEHGREFVISWRVKNASDIQLYRNGDFYQIIREDDGQLEVVENVYDRYEKSTEFELIASKSGQVVTQLLRIQVIQRVPVVESFQVGDYVEKNGNEYVVESNKPFSLYWDVKNAETVRLYKDGKPLHIEPNESQIEFTERVYGDKERSLEFRLDASDNSTTASSSITILVKNFTTDPPPPAHQPPPPPEPIVEFDLEGYQRKKGKNDYAVIAGKQYRLRWHVENVTSVGLLRNGKPLQLQADQVFFELREPGIDGQETKVEYTLVASTGSEILRRSIQVTVKKPAAILIPINVLILVVGLIVLAIIATVVYKSVSDKGENIIQIRKDTPTRLITRPSVIPLNLNQLSEGDTLRIAGSNLPENDHSVIVRFNDAIDAAILQQASNSLNVLVPHVLATTVNIKVKVTDGDEFIIASNLPYKAKPFTPAIEAPVKIFPPRIRTITEDEILTITGSNLPREVGLIRVKFNEVNGKIISQNARKVTVKVPGLPDPELVDIEMVVRGNFFFVAEGVKYKGKVTETPVITGRVTLNPFSQDVITEGETITITGNNIPIKEGSVEIIFDGRVSFPIVEQTSTSIRASVPTLVLRSGILAVKANGNYIPLPRSLVDYRLRQ